MLAHCERLVEPSTIRPASRSFVTSGASWGTGRPSNAVDPALPGRPTTSTLSLMRIGTPCSGLRSVPRARSSSKRFAVLSASGASASTLRSSMSLSGESIRAIRSVNAVTIATDDVAPDARASASSSAVASQSSVLVCVMLLLDDAEINTAIFFVRLVAACERTRRKIRSPLESSNGQIGSKDIRGTGVVDAHQEGALRRRARDGR